MPELARHLRVTLSELILLQKIAICFVALLLPSAAERFELGLKFLKGFFKGGELGIHLVQTFAFFCN